MDSESNLIETGEAEIGNLAPDFTLTDAQGALWQLSAHRGHIIALLFYPGDETLVCTKQLCSMRDQWEDYLATGAQIVGISPGSVEVHERFAAEHHLPMTLLADEHRRITKRYATHWLFPIWTTRALVVVDAEGIIRHRHIVLRALRPSDKNVIAAIRMAQYDKLVARSF